MPRRTEDGAIQALARWEGAPRAWALGFLLLAGLGLAVAVYYVHLTAGFGGEDLAARFSGPERGDIAPHSFRSLLQTTHTHLFTLAFLQLALGGFFLLSSAPDGLKAWVAGGGFLAVLLDHAAMWAAFRFGPAFTPAISACGSLMTLAFALEWAWCLKDLLGPRRP